MIGGQCTSERWILALAKDEKSSLVRLLYRKTVGKESNFLDKDPFFINNLFIMCLS